MTHLESPMKNEMANIVDRIRTALTTGKKVKSTLDAMLPTIFNFRIKAIKWLIEKNEFDLSGIIDERYPQLEELKENPKLEILAENILFALRCNRRVMEALIGTGDFSEERFAANSVNLPTITYEQFLATLAFSVPDDEAAQKLVDLVNTSLYIEFIILSASIINDEKLKTSDKIINELAFLIANAAQEYSAIAAELGILKPHLINQISFSGQFDKMFIKEQKYLAELGINDFAENF